MSESWDERYRTGETPWDIGEPSTELVRHVREHEIPAGEALEVGCGTGNDAIWLAEQGFRVTACDVSPRALEIARGKPGADRVRWVQADVLTEPELGGPFDLVYDRGVYHVLRRIDGARYLRWIAGRTRPGARYVLLAGNANEPEPHEGPPRVHAHELCAELQPWWDLVELREMRFDGVDLPSRPAPWGWSALFRRR